MGTGQLLGSRAGGTLARYTFDAGTGFALVQSLPAGTSPTQASVRTAVR